MELQASTLMESMYLYGQILLYTNMVNNLNIRITYKNRNDVSVMSCFAMYIRRAATCLLGISLRINIILKIKVKK